MQILHSQHTHILQYLNLHSHYKPQATNEISIRNAYHYFPRHTPTGQYYSVGIHPWHIHKFVLEDIGALIKPLLKHPKVVAIGEIGLDKLSPKLDLQASAFLVQTEIAEAAQLPLIVHCVKAYPMLFSLIKASKGSIILHNYYANEVITANFLKLPNVYFSLGRRFRLSQGLNQAYAKMIPIERLFIETDISREPVSNAYSAIAEKLEISQERLASSISKNALLVFKKMDEF